MAVSPHLLALATTLTLVVTAGPGETQQRPDRSSIPAAGPIPSLTLPAIEKRSLKNGLAIWLVEQHEVPVVEVQLLVRTGSGADPAGRFGLASLTAAMLDEGAGERDALAIADAIDYLGADLDTGSSFDASFVRLHVPVARLADVLPLMADVALRPRFPVQELERIRQERLTALLQARDNSGQIASFAYSRTLYGPAHRYGTPDMGTTEAIKSLTVEDLRSFHGNHYRPDLATLLVVGDVTPQAVLLLLERAFGDWAAPVTATPPVVTDAPQQTRRRVSLVDKPGAAQSEIRIGWIGVSRTTPDYFALEVLNTILGGAFSSRLNQNLREEHGYSYGAGSAFVMRLAAGPFIAAAAVQTDKTAPALTEFLNELEGMQQPVPAEELSRAKNYLTLRFPQQFETTRQIAGRLSELFIYRLDESELRQYRQRVEAVTAADVQAAAKKYLQPNKFAVVVVGDRQVIEKDVRALDLGPVTTLSVRDVMGPD